jgi:hypothetical protein
MMKRMGAAGAIFVALVGLSAAAPADRARRPNRMQTIVCIRHDGSIYNPRCVKSSTGPRACDCGADFHVIEPYCDLDESPAPSTADANRARFAAASRGSLEQAKYQGRRFCVRLPGASVSDPNDGMGSGVELPPRTCCGGG